MTASSFKAEALMFEPAWSDAGRGQRLAFMQDVSVARDLRAGPEASTGNPLDLAIHGPGYFAIETAQRAYDLNSKVITASDEMMATITQLR